MKKLVLALLLAVHFISFSAQAEVDAGDIFDLIGDIVREDGRHDNRTEYRPGRPNRPGRPDYPGHPGYPGGGGYGPISCTYVDEGHEEHSRGHRSCGECLSLHGNCIETCVSQVAECSAVGIDYSGRQRVVYAQDQDRWYAERRAMEYCRYEGLRNCRVDRCSYQQDVVSERLCR